MPAAPQPDPPIYRALLDSWTRRGRTLPGRHDPEWAALTAAPVVLGARAVPAPPVTLTGTGGLGRVSPFQDRRGDGR